MRYRGGVYWGAGEHRVCAIARAAGEHRVCAIARAAGKIVLKVPMPHAAAGLADLTRRLARLAQLAALPVVIERPSGLLVETLLAAGHRVVPIYTNVVGGSRPRCRPAGGKSRPRNAYMLADLLRTDGRRFRPLAPSSDELKALPALVRARDDLVAQTQSVLYAAVLLLPPSRTKGRRYTVSHGVGPRAASRPVCSRDNLHVMTPPRALDRPRPV